MNHIAFLVDAAEIVLTHHERFDGTGYPQGLSGANIPLGARIFAVADTLDAMTSDRPYRRALPFATAREEMIRESGKQFDPEVVSAFLAIDESVWSELRTKGRIPRSLGIEQGKLVLPAQSKPSLLATGYDEFETRQKGAEAGVTCFARRPATAGKDLDDRVGCSSQLSVNSVRCAASREAGRRE